MVPGFLSAFSSVTKRDLERQDGSISAHRSRVWIPGRAKAAPWWSKHTLEAEAGGSQKQHSVNVEDRAQ